MGVIWVVFDELPWPGKKIGKRWMETAGPAKKLLFSYLGFTQMTQAWIKVNAFARGNEIYVSWKIFTITET